MLALSAAQGGLRAQGTGSYFNVESPQRKPITVARVAGHDYIVACNTPDNAVEIYDTHGENEFITRVQTGAEPISVVWNPALSKLFTCNFLGDSITMISLSAPSGSLVATLERTVEVGDEPNHLAFAADNQSLFVTLGSQSGMGWLYTSDLSPLPGLGRIDLLDHTGNLALKDPGVAAVVGNKLFVLGNRNGRPGSNFHYQFGIRVQDIVSGTISEINGIGTHSFSMTFSQTGDLYVVGQDARVDQFFGETNVRNADKGFTGSLIYKIESAAGGSPTGIFSRDLNSDASNQQVAHDLALSQPTDVALYEPTGTVQKIFVAAFGSGRVADIPPGAIPLGTSDTISEITIPLVAGSTNPMSGPRGLAIKYASGITGDPGDRLYVLNRLDNAISVINPSNDAMLKTFALRRDPTPSYIRKGREFLYGAHLSGSGIVSCASCHLDGRSDFLPWSLSDNTSAAIPTGLMEGVINPLPSQFFPSNKGQLMTQTLQGMVNFETQPEVQDYFSNEPLHWRADRATFLNFQGAFTSLLGGPGISDAQMKDFRKFVFSIAYPPNPEEPLNRTFSGTFGCASNETDGTGAQRGMKLFHMRPLTVSGGGTQSAGRSCVQCHALPEGSDNKITITNASSGTSIQPLETPALRLLRQKDSVLEKMAGLPLSPAITGPRGLDHEGLKASITDFVFGFFLTDLNGSNEAKDVAQFVREFDTGVGPLVGHCVTIDQSTVASPFTAIVFDLAEGQARLANNGVAVQGRIGSAMRGFWFDLTLSTPAYREEPGGATFTRDQILALITQSSDRLVIQGTPLGSERRFAWTGTGSPTPISGSAPASITLEPVKPDTAYARVPELTKNWDPNAYLDTDKFVWGSSSIPTPPRLKAIRLMQYGLIQNGPEFGLSALRHEAPRRFRVALSNGRHGARLQLTMGLDPDNAPPDSKKTVTFDLPIYPTDQVNSEGKKIWETAVEADALTIYKLMLGGPKAPKVQDTLDGIYTPDEPPEEGTLLYDPARWNLFKVVVVNEDGTSGDGGWQPLTIQ